MEVRGGRAGRRELGEADREVVFDLRWIGARMLIVYVCLLMYILINIL